MNHLFVYLNVEIVKECRAPCDAYCHYKYDYSMYEKNYLDKLVKKKLMKMYSSGTRPKTTRKRTKSPRWFTLAVSGKRKRDDIQNPESGSRIE